MHVQRNVQESRAVTMSLVSTPHAVPLGLLDGPVERPSGTKHARRAGQELTASGKSSAVRRMFWDLKYRSEDGEGCSACAKALSATEVAQ